MENGEQKNGPVPVCTLSVDPRSNHCIFALRFVITHGQINHWILIVGNNNNSTLVRCSEFLFFYCPKHLHFRRSRMETFLKCRRRHRFDVMATQNKTEIHITFMLVWIYWTDNGLERTHSTTHAVIEQLNSGRNDKRSDTLSMFTCTFELVVASRIESRQDALLTRWKEAHHVAHEILHFVDNIHDGRSDISKAGNVLILQIR